MRRQKEEKFLYTYMKQMVSRYDVQLDEILNAYKLAYEGEDKKLLDDAIL